MLEVEGIDTYYGLSQVLFDVSLDVKPGEVVCLMGRNGAGKTTTMRSIINLTPPHRGSVRLEGREITGMPPHKVVRRGLGYVPDDRRIFPDLTVRENLELGERKSSKGGKWTVEGVYSLFESLRPLDKRRGGNLSGGEQQMLCIARALMGNPRLLLLDEPTEGLAPLVIRQLEEQILLLREEGISILLAEQNVKSALCMADRGYIVDSGRIRYEGSRQDLEENEEIRNKYLLV